MKISKYLLSLVIIATILSSCGPSKELSGYWQLFKKKFQTGVEEGEFGDENMLLNSDGTYIFDSRVESFSEKGTWKIEASKNEEGKRFDVLVLTPSNGKARSFRILSAKNKNLELEESSSENGIEYKVVKYYIQTDNKEAE